MPLYHERPFISHPKAALSAVASDGSTCAASTQPGIALHPGASLASDRRRSHLAWFLIAHHDDEGSQALAPGYVKP